MSPPVSLTRESPSLSVLLHEASLIKSEYELLQCLTPGAERRAGRLHRRWKAEVTVRSSVWFGARCRLVYFIIDFNRQAPGQVRWAKRSAERSPGTAFSFCSRWTIIRLRITIS